MLTLILLTILLIWLLFSRWQRRKLVQLSNQLKSDYRALPFFGHSYMLSGSDEDRMKALQIFGRDAMKHGGVSPIWHANHLYICVADPEVAEFVLKNCLEKADVVKKMRFLVGNGSIFAEVPIWRIRRKIVALAFGLKTLNKYMDVFSKQTSIMIDKMQPNVGKGAFSIWNYLTTFTMDSVCETTFGVEIKSQQNSDHPFLKAFKRICLIGAARLCKPWLYNVVILKKIPTEAIKCKQELCNFIDKIIKEKRKELSNRIKNDMSDDLSKDVMKTSLELLIKFSGGNKGFTNLELQEETLVLVLGGTDTSATSACFTAVMLSKRQDVQEKVYQELQEVFGDSSRPIETSDLPRLKYLEAVIKESMRLYPPVPIIARKVDKDVELPSGLRLVKGCGILINVWALHRNPKSWGSDAEVFKPERFIHNPTNAAFMGFSQGPRNCLGQHYAMMTLKTALADLLRQYRLLPALSKLSDADTSENTSVRVKYDIIMKDVDNFKLQLVSRH